MTTSTAVSAVFVLLILKKQVSWVEQSTVVKGGSSLRDDRFGEVFFPERRCFFHSLGVYYVVQRFHF